MNKKLICWGISLASALVFSSTLSAKVAPGSTLLNPEFKATDGGIPDGWEAYPPPSGDSQKMAADPAGGVKITDQDPARGLGLAQWVAVTPGTRYSARLTVAGEGSVNLYLIFTATVPTKSAMIGQMKLLEVPQGFSAAKQDPLIATAPAGANFMRVFVYSSKPGKCDLTVKSIELKTVDGGAVDTKPVPFAASASAAAAAIPAATGAAPAIAGAPAASGTAAPRKAIVTDASGKQVTTSLQGGAEMIPAGKVYTIDFETGDYSQCRILEGGNKAIVSAPDPVRAGKYALKVMLTHDQHRTEAAGGRSEAYGEFKYGWSIFLPETFDGQSFFSIVSQWHTWGSGKDYPRDGGPPTSISIAKDTWSLKILHQDGTEFKVAKANFPFGSIKDDKGKWTDFYMEVNWQSPKTGGGYLRLYKNGVKVVDYTGPTWFDEKTKGPYFKVGVYKGSAGWKGEESGAVLYFDELRMGDKTVPREAIDPAMQSKAAK